MTRAFFCLRAVAVLLAGSGLAAKLEVNLADQKLVEERLQRGEVRFKERQNAIRQLFSDAGCAAEEQPLDKKSANVICTLPGETPSTIVVGGHFDFSEHGKGIVDDWSGASLLPSLYQAVKNQRRKHTYTFVAFAGEERGLLGSNLYVKSLTAEQKANLHAFVNLECLGLTPVKVWINRSTPELVLRLMEVANAIQVVPRGVNVDKVGDDDTHPFLRAGIAVICIHSITQETFPILHTPRDQLSAIHPVEYYDTYKLVAFYLAYLDEKLR